MGDLQRELCRPIMETCKKEDTLVEGRGCVRGQPSLPRMAGKLGVQLGSVVGRRGLTSQLCSAQARQAGQAQRWWPGSMESPDHQGSLR